MINAEYIEDDNKLFVDNTQNHQQRIFNMVINPPINEKKKN